MKIEVEVWCYKCDKAMVGDDVMYESPATGLQAREYTCDCGQIVGVGLYPVKEKEHGLHRSRVQ